MKPAAILTLVLLAAATVPHFVPPAVPAVHDDFARRASWTLPTADQLRAELEPWLTSLSLSAEQQGRIQAIWGADSSSATPLDRLLRTAAVVDQRAAQLLDQCARAWDRQPLAPPPVLDDSALPLVIRDNLRLHYGTWLAIHHLYNEAETQLSQLKPERIADPASLLFYQSVAYHALRERDQCLNTIARLLECSEQLPKRFVTTARLMEADIRSLAPDTLDEVARLMNSIRIRLGHARAGKRVRQEEDETIEKLDKMIEQLEQQLAAAQAQSGSQGGANNPQSPMEDSFGGGQSGPGNVDPRRLGADTDWGNLPPKEREEALQQLSKDFPSHYRDVIEDYFRKLARDGVGEN